MLIFYLLVSLLLCLLFVTFIAPYYPLKHAKNICVATVAIKCSKNLDKNISRVISTINSITTSYQNVDIIFLGEMILSHYIIDKSQLNDLSLSLNDERLKIFQDIAVEKNIVLCFGFIEFSNGKYFNSQILINSNGDIVGVHRKKNLTSFENELFSQGDTCLTTFNVNGNDIGLLICYDIFHKELTNSYKEQRPQIMLHSLADPLNPEFPTGYNGRKTDSIYVSANRFGKEGKTYFSGHIAIVSSCGRILSLKHGGENEIVENITLETSPNIIRDCVNSISNTILKTIHLFKHYKHVINFLKWNHKTKKSKK